MANALAQSLEKVGRHPGVVAAGRFLRWWRDELIGGLPEKWRAQLRTEPSRVLIEVGDDETVLRRGNGTELGRFATNEDPAVAGQATQGVVARMEEARPELVALLPADRLLHRYVTFPAATQDNLRQVLTFEMDRHTPFKADEVYFDHRVVETLAGGSKIRVMLHVARREDGQRLLEFCRERGLKLHGIDTEDERGEQLGLNLLPLALREQRDRRQIRLNLALAAVFLVLLNVVLWQSVGSREAALDVYQQRLNTVRQEAAQVIELRDELEATARAAGFLSQKKGATPAVLELLREFTSRLPDDTWLQRMQINGDTVQISGQTPAAAALVGLLEESPCLEAPNLRGAVTPDPQSGKERFTIEVSIKAGGCGDGAAAS